MALKPDGYIILFESILPIDTDTHALHAEIEQQNCIRTSEFYLNLFKRAGLKTFRHRHTPGFE
jgi:hypothetical protein